MEPVDERTAGVADVLEAQHYAFAPEDDADSER
jgi:hypothetical protein